MFAVSQTNQLAAAALANEHMKAWEKTLALRISLQKSLDIGNQLPTESVLDLYNNDKDNEIVHASSDLAKSLQVVLRELVDATNTQAEHITSDGSFKATKRKRADETVTWDQVQESQDHMNAYWERVVNKWHARLNFGSEHVKSKLKVFNQTIWNQVTSVSHNVA